MVGCIFDSDSTLLFESGVLFSGPDIFSNHGKPWGFILIYKWYAHLSKPSGLLYSARTLLHMWMCGDPTANIANTCTAERVRSL